MNRSEKQRVLVIEDEAHIAEGLKLNLALKGYSVRIVPDGISALKEWKEWHPDLIVLDIMLPGIDGLTVLRNIRLEDRNIPILILSAKGDSEDKVKGFSDGADDYLSKPFNLEEFLLRVERLLFRAAQHQGRSPAGGEDGVANDTVYTFGSNRIDFSTLTAYGPAGKINLTEQEARLLKLFISHRGIPISRKKLLEIGWGYAHGTESRTVDNFVVRLRKYFEKDPKKPLHFKSLRSVGYLFDPDGE
ncbi:MAG: response regulator transcription factor [Deltaproteobacteria bacterium]|nr:response regulator transcription factor [Deltaproteobacteria bacterium]MBW1962240.1 response regulator transcription factor [Deltaproteobacteria bacterium]MBW2153723.1 response regulator transcription factor [Deltaproteobacteria bacterium]